MHQPAGSAAVEFSGVTFAYPGESAPALKGVTLRVESGERLGVLGPNGGGKSTLLKIALGLVGGYSGEVRVCGLSPRRARRAGLIGYVPQRSEAILGFPVSARQAVEMSAARRVAWWRATPNVVAERVARCLELVGAADLAERPVGALSGGQLQRVLIARAIAGEPRILALDEPTVGIDAAGQRRFADMLASLHEALGLTILIVSHDVRAVAAACDRVACLARTLHFHDTPGGLTPQVLAEVFRHDVSSVFGDLHVDAHLATACPVEEPHAHDHGACEHDHGAARPGRTEGAP